jgi:inhibitor of cysteine peptidase
MKIFWPGATSTAVAVLTCAAVAAGMANMPERVFLTQQDQGRTVNVHVGQSVVLSLPENASTGYRWAIDHLDAHLVKAGEPMADYPSSGAVGSGGHLQWAFRIEAAGDTEIALKRWRPWEGERSVVERFRILLHIVAP